MDLQLIFFYPQTMESAPRSSCWVGRKAENLGAGSNRYSRGSTSGATTCCLQPISTRQVCLRLWKKSHWRCLRVYFPGWLPNQRSSQTSTHDHRRVERRRVGLGVGQPISPNQSSRGDQSKFGDLAGNPEGAFSTWKVNEIFLVFTRSGFTFYSVCGFWQRHSIPVEPETTEDP